MANEKIWALMVILSKNEWTPVADELEFDDSFWDYVVEESAKSGINTILLDVGDGVQYETHPEISLPDAWSKERVKKEVKKCRDLGIELIPKLNFSTGHSYWQKEWRKMTSTKPYYDFCSDIIKEIYEMFDHPKYIHIGYDEEVPFIADRSDYVVYRKGELLFRDFKFLIDEVNKTGATPWAWNDPLWEHSEDYLKLIDPKENVILSPWFYMGMKKEHYTPIPQYDENGTEHEWYKEGYRYQEEVPMMSNAISYFHGGIALEHLKLGFKFIPTPSVYCNDYNTDDLIEYFKNGSPDEQILGYLTAPWVWTIWEEKEKFDKSLRLLAEAREKYYGE